MTTTTMEERLAEVGRHIDRLQARADTGATEPEARMRRHLEALRHEEAAARAALRNASDELEDRLDQLDARLDVAERSLAADATEDRAKYAAAVEAELVSWDAYLERLQTNAAVRAARGRERAEAMISDLRQHRITVAERLTQVRDASGDTWHEQKTDLAAAREELERKADELLRADSLRR